MKFRRCLFTAYIKQEIRQIHVVARQEKKRQENEQKSVEKRVQSCCFA